MKQEKELIIQKHNEYYKSIKCQPEMKGIAAALLVIADILNEIGYAMPKEKIER